MKPTFECPDELPDPDPGYEWVLDRIPAHSKGVKYWSELNQEVIVQKGSHDKASRHMYIHQRKIKTPRYMTPQECAGKWLVFGGAAGRSYISDFTVTKLSTSHSNWFTPYEAHGKGYMIANTPTSEPYSLLIEE